MSADPSRCSTPKTWRHAGLWYRPIIPGVYAVMRAESVETNPSPARIAELKPSVAVTSGHHCPAIDGLISEADDVAGEGADKQVLDAAIVGVAQSVEHYEIARYGTPIAWADELRHDDVVRLLTTNLNEEKAADKKLSTVALRNGVNRRAAS